MGDEKMFSHLAIHISHLLLYYFLLIIDIKAGIPIVSSETRMQRRTQSNLVSTRPESLRITKIIVPTFYPPFFVGLRPTANC